MSAGLRPDGITLALVVQRRGEVVAERYGIQPENIFQPEIENIYGEYDPELAKSLLDGIGLPAGADGMRTFADGSELILVIEGNSQWSQNMLDGLELVAENWRDIGLNTQVEVSTRDLYWPRAGANEVMIATWGTDRGLGTHRLGVLSVGQVQRGLQLRLIARRPPAEVVHALVAPADVRDRLPEPLGELVAERQRRIAHREDAGAAPVDPRTA